MGRIVVTTVSPVAALLLAALIHCRYTAIPLATTHGPLTPWRWISNAEAVAFILGAVVLAVALRWARPRGGASKLKRALSCLALLACVLPVLTTVGALKWRTDTRRSVEHARQMHDLHRQFIPPGD